jgi:DNA-binding IscR family transcriptional regulator
MASMMSKDNVKPISLTLLSEREHVSVRYLEQIFGLLRRNGIVKGKRGPGGGYVLGLPPDEDTCVTRPLWVNLRDMFCSYMSEKTLQDLIDGNI